MQKVTKSSVGAEYYPEGVFLEEGTADAMIGKLCTLIDACGLKESQEKSIKDLIKQTVRERFSNEYGAVFIPSTLSRVIIEMDVERANQPYTSPMREAKGGDWELTFIPRD